MVTTISPSISPPIRHLWTFDAHANLPHKVNYLWKIHSGVIRGYTWLEDGSVVTLGLWGADDTLSKTFSRVQPLQLECVTEVQASLVLGQNTADMVQHLLSYAQVTQELLIIRSHKNVESMIMALFNWLGKKFGVGTSKGKLIDLRLTHQEISEILGTTRVTITRALSNLEKQGYIERERLHRFVLREEEFWHYEI